MERDQSLHNHLLIAMPGMQDPRFSSTVTLVCEHNDEGALGIIINRPSGLTLGGRSGSLHLNNSMRRSPSLKCCMAARSHPSAASCCTNRPKGSKAQSRSRLGSN